MSSTTASKGPPLWRSMRFKIALIGFFGGSNIFIQRSNLSIAIVCMVNHTAVDLLKPKESPLVFNSSQISDNKTNQNGGVTCGDLDVLQSSKEDGEFVWTKETQGILLGAVFWGYVALQMFGGFIIERFGLRHAVGPFFVAMSTLTMLSHPAALWTPWALFTVRIFIGLTSAVCMPGLFFILSTWAPPDEKSRLSSIVFAGNMFGNVLVYPIAGLLCTYGFAGGWPSIFYVSGALSFVCCVFWYIWVYDSPDKHPFIEADERDYIISCLEGTKSDTKPKTPWCNIITSLPVYAGVLAHTSLCWGLYLMLSNLPLYMREILKFNATANGIFTMLPYICMWVTMLVSGILIDKITNKFGLSFSRRATAFCALIVPAVLLVIVGYLDCHYTELAVVLLCLIISCLSLVFTGVLVNFFDIAPRFSGQILTFSNTLANVTGIITPYTVAYFTPDKTQEQWQKVFFLSAGIIAFGGLMFIIFARVTVQDWAVKEPTGIEIKQEKY